GARAVPGGCGGLTRGVADGSGRAAARSSRDWPAGAADLPSAAARCRVSAGARLSGLTPVTPRAASEVTPPSLMPQGTIGSNHARSVVTLRARPWVVTPWLSLTPIAASLSRPTQAPV